jgi:hypothetical protein
MAVHRPIYLTLGGDADPPLSTVLTAREPKPLAVPEGNQKELPLLLQQTRTHEEEHQV